MRSPSIKNVGRKTDGAVKVHPPRDALPLFYFADSPGRHLAKGASRLWFHPDGAAKLSSQLSPANAVIPSGLTLDVNNPDKVYDHLARAQLRKNGPEFLRAVTDHNCVGKAQHIIDIVHH